MSSGTDLDVAHDSRQLVAIQQLPPDLMLLKMENESIMSVARAQPRDPMKIVGQLRALIDAYPAAAEEAIYKKPVGTVLEVTCGTCGVRYELNKIDNNSACPACEAHPMAQGKQSQSRKVKKFAEGLSIRAAESIRSIYGYTRLATTTEILPDGKAKLTGVLVDYAAGNLTSDERIVANYYKARGGGMVKIDEDRFLNVVVKAEKSKLKRDVILDSVPNIVKAMFRDACEQKMTELVAPEVIDQKILPAFREYGITLEHLEKIVGRPKSLGWRESERLELRKILTGLKNEEMTVRELLADLDEPKRPTAPTNGATMDDLTGASKQKPEPPAGSETAKETPQGAPSDGAAFEEQITAAKAIREVDAVLDAWISRFPADQQDAAREAAEARKAEIRASRGQGSKPDAQGSLLPAGDEPTEAQIKAKVETYRKRLRNASSVKAVDSVWNEIEADPYVPDEDKEQLRIVYRQRRAELG